MNNQDAIKLIRDARFLIEQAIIKLNGMPMATAQLQSVIVVFDELIGPKA